MMEERKMIRIKGYRNWARGLQSVKLCDRYQKITRRRQLLIEPLNCVAKGEKLRITPIYFPVGLKTFGRLFEEENVYSI